MNYDCHFVFDQSLYKYATVHKYTIAIIISYNHFIKISIIIKDSECDKKRTHFHQLIDCFNVLVSPWGNVKKTFFVRDIQIFVLS